MQTRRREPANWGHFALLAGAVWGVSALLLVATGAGSASIPIAASCGLSGLLALVFALAGARQSRRHEAKVSAELTSLSERLLALERAGATSEGRGDRAWPVEAGGVAADLGVLSRLVSHLAEALDVQEQEIRALRARQDRDASDWAAASVPVAQPNVDIPLSPMSVDLRSREDFARTAAVILQKLSPRPADARAGPAVPPAEPASEEPVLSALEAGRLELYLQPIVTLPQRRTRFFEAQSRLRIPDEDQTASLVEDKRFLSILSRHGRLPAFDRQMLARVFAVARHISTGESGAAIILPISADSLRDPGFLDETERLFAGDPAAARRLMISVAETEFEALGTGERASLARLAAFGPALALNQSTNLAADWAALARDGIALVAIEADLILHAAHGGEMAGAFRTMARAGIHLVATGIDRESDVPDLIERDVPFAQGQALGAPRPMRTDFGTPAIVAEAEPVPQTRVSLRDVLRRAG